MWDARNADRMQEFVAAMRAASQKAEEVAVSGNATDGIRLDA